MIDIAEVLTGLATQRPIFHSEADFQHAFAWEIHRRLPNASIRLELPVLHLDKQLYLDVWAIQGNAILAVELKYKTRALSVQIGDEQFSLKDQRAQDIGRYDFIKDIQRLEQIVSSLKNIIGYAILLTNDRTYWTRPKANRPVDADFRLQQGRILHSTLSWGVGASAGTKRGREEPLELNGTYVVHWKNYSQPSAKSYGRFRYLAVKVDE
jgi:hypothetical protein